MKTQEQIAEKITKSLQSINVTCSRENNLVNLPDWEVHVEVFDGDANRQQGQVSLCPTIMTYHPLLPDGFALELAVGMGTNDEEAVSNIAAGWLVLFYPLLKFLFDEHPHDCTVSEVPMAVPHALFSDYRRIEGPIQVRGFGAEDRVDQSYLWDALAAKLLPGISGGVHHIRCFLCRLPDQSSADVFLDGVEWPEGSAILRGMAAEFPAPTQEVPMYSMKQHILLRPVDMAGSAKQERAAEIERWTRAVSSDITVPDRDFLPHVLKGLHLFSRHLMKRGCELDAVLIAQGIPGPIAAGISTFIESAAARVLMKGRFVFAEEYKWVNSKTYCAVDRRYDQTPVFMAMVNTFTALLDKGLAKGALQSAAGSSAEINLLRKAAADGADLNGGNVTFSAMYVFTDEPVDGPKLHLPETMPSESAPSTTTTAGEGEPKKRPWWKFW